MFDSDSRVVEERSCWYGRTWGLAPTCVYIYIHLYIYIYSIYIYIYVYVCFCSCLCQTASMLLRLVQAHRPSPSNGRLLGGSGGGAEHIYKVVPP